MVASASVNRKKAFFIALLFVVVSVFTMDVIDLREELQIIPCSDSCLDNSLATVITSSFAFETETLLILRSGHSNSSIAIKLLYLLPHGLRAPPFQS